MRLLKFIARFLNQHTRVKVAFLMLLEAAWVRPGEALKVEMTIHQERDLDDVIVQFYGPHEFSVELGTPPEEPHNNISHGNAAGCDGVQCGPEHTKGDF